MATVKSWRECMMLGPQIARINGLQVCDRADEGYMRECAEFDGNFYCAQARGPCSDEVNVTRRA